MIVAVSRMEWVHFSILCNLLVALLQTSQLFILNAEPKYFIRFCSHWLLPALLLHEDNTNLDWVAKVRRFHIFYGLTLIFQIAAISVYSLNFCNEIETWIIFLLVFVYFVWALQIKVRYLNFPISISLILSTICRWLANRCLCWSKKILCLSFR